METKVINVTESTVREDIDISAFNAMMQRGFEQVKVNQSRPLADVFAELKQGL